MSFHIAGLDPADFAHAFDHPDAVTRVDAKPGAPCRISLDDAEAGERVALLTYQHQPADTPYRQQGPIFVRENVARFDAVGVIPPAMGRRTLSLRAFDHVGMMIEAELIDGREAESLIERFFANAEVAYIHAHYAKRGCFAARIDRA